MTVAVFFALMLGVPAALLLCTYVARDMDRRGLDGRLYGAVALFVPPVGLAMWLVQRSAHAVIEDEGGGDEEGGADATAGARRL